MMVLITGLISLLAFFDIANLTVSQISFLDNIKSLDQSRKEEQSSMGKPGDSDAIAEQNQMLENTVQSLDRWSEAERDYMRKTVKSDVTSGEQNWGKEFFEGDLVLTDDQKAMVNNNSCTHRRAAIRDTLRTWKDAIVPYALSKHLDVEGKQTVNNAMAEWEKHTCIRFKRRTTEKNYIEFDYKGGCWSWLGYVNNGVQPISIGTPSQRCLHGSVVHEIGHSLGFFHEHARPDRDDYVTILWNKIPIEMHKEFTKMSAKLVNSMNVPYDYGSVMHYSKYAFGLRPGQVTIETKGSKSDIGQRKGLSKLDIQQANLLYEC